MTIHFLSAFRIEVRLLQRNRQFYQAVTKLYSTTCITDNDPSIMSKETVEEFPVWALQPRIETGATAFMNKFPTFDGRGTVIAIFDSGKNPNLSKIREKLFTFSTFQSNSFRFDELFFQNCNVISAKDL